MQVILMEKVVNLGSLGDVVRVRDGYARNFLIPQGKAKRVTPENLAEFEKRRKPWKAPAFKATRGTLYKYIKNVKSASEGCVTDE